MASRFESHGSDHAFLEYHFYRGGLRTEPLSISETRPGWAPPPDWVGFRDEFVLDANDKVLELVKFDGDSGPIAWIGLYEAAPDQVYGDRRNHAGIGVWLLNGYPKEPTLLLDALKSLLEIARKDEGKRLPLQAKKFLNEYLKDYVSDYEILPPPLGGMNHALNPILPTLTFSLNIDHEEFEKKFDDIIYRLFYFLPEEESKNSRSLILLSSGNGNENNIGFKVDGILNDIVSGIPIAFREQSRLISSLQSEVEREAKTVEELDWKVDEMSVQLASAIARAEGAESQLKDLQASLAEDDSRKQFSRLQSSVSDLGYSVSQLNSKISSLKQEIVYELKRDVGYKNKEKKSGSELRAKLVPVEENYNKKFLNRIFSDQNFKIITLSLFLFSLIVLAIILIPRLIN